MGREAKDAAAPCSFYGHLVGREAKDAAARLPAHRTVHATKNYPAPDVNCTGIEKA